jgi:hypothetical protein
MEHPKFNIGDTVYHNTPNSDEALVIEVIYSYLRNTHAYIVSTGFGVEYECAEHELTDEKTLF